MNKDVNDEGYKLVAVSERACGGGATKERKRCVATDLGVVRRQVSGDVGTLSEDGHVTVIVIGGGRR